MIEIRETIELITKAHAGQIRLFSGEPFINHPMAVAFNAANLAIRCNPKLDADITWAILTAGLLHDVVEDTDVTLDKLEEIGYPEHILNSVKLLTRRENQTHNESVAEIIASGDFVASIVKLCDVWHNSTLTPAGVEWCKKNGKVHDQLKDRYTRSAKLLVNSPALTSMFPDG